MTWTIEKLNEWVASFDGWTTESEQNCLTISNDEGVDIFAYTGANQVIFESVLFPANAVSDTAALNTLILDTHQLLPLSTVGTRVIDNERYYVAFGALSTESKPEVVLEEIETLFDNIPEFIELYADFINEEQAA